MIRYTSRKMLIAIAGVVAISVFAAFAFLFSTHDHIGDGHAGDCVLCAFTFSSLASGESHRLTTPLCVEICTVRLVSESAIVFELLSENSVRAPPTA